MRWLLDRWRLWRRGHPDNACKQHINGRGPSYKDQNRQVHGNRNQKLCRIHEVNMVPSTASAPARSEKKEQKGTYMSLCVIRVCSLKCKAHESIQRSIVPSLEKQDISQGCLATIRPSIGDMDYSCLMHASCC